MNAGVDEDLARSINSDFDRLIERQRTAGRLKAIQAARATAFAAVAFLDQVAGRLETLELIGELVEA
ncbi:hypothetical protein [Mesorhizobium shangrilense]|uniref:Uncharacterized protein n=1 Tax=Mesorhizobium shangrilense TaxID=460060 RepID=A0ABV2DFR2_9HYPH